MDVKSPGRTRSVPRAPRPSPARPTVAPQPSAPRPSPPELTRAALATIDPRLSRDLQAMPSAAVNALWGDGDGGVEQQRWTPEQIQAQRDEMKQLEGQMAVQVEKLNQVFANGTPEERKAVIEGLATNDTLDPRLKR